MDRQQRLRFATIDSRLKERLHHESVDLTSGYIRVDPVSVRKPKFRC